MDFILYKKPVGGIKCQFKNPGSRGEAVFVLSHAKNVLFKKMVSRGGGRIRIGKHGVILNQIVIFISVDFRYIETEKTRNVCRRCIFCCQHIDVCAIILFWIVIVILNSLKTTPGEQDAKEEYFY